MNNIPTGIWILIALPIHLIARFLESRAWVWWNYKRYGYAFPENVWKEEIQVPGYASQGFFLAPIVGILGLTVGILMNLSDWSKSAKDLFGVIAIATIVSPLLAGLLRSFGGSFAAGAGTRPPHIEQLHQRDNRLTTRIENPDGPPDQILQDYRRLWRALNRLHLLAAADSGLGVADRLKLANETAVDLQRYAQPTADPLFDRRIDRVKADFAKRLAVLRADAAS